MDATKFLLVSDLDGTLFNTERALSKENLSAINDFMAAGGRFTVATGRMTENTKEMLGALVANTAGIFLNGAVVADWDGRVLTMAELEEPIWRDFVREMLAKYPTVCTQIYTTEKCYILSDPAYDDPRIKREYAEYYHISFERALRLPWVKLFFYAEDVTLLHEIWEHARKAKLTERSTSFFSAPRYLEFVGKEASKGHMVDFLRTLPENAARIVIAAGNYGNDDEMLRRADLGIAPVDAAEDTKRVADLIGPSCNEHLWAYIIEKILPVYETKYADTMKEKRARRRT